MIGLALGYKAVGNIEWILLVKVLLCMVFARNAAMAFNRWADERFDKANPRTSNREIPAGIITKTNALRFVIINCIAFVATTFFINWLCFWLSPIALVTILGYSLTKRWTFLCHLILGCGLALAPIGAYLAVAGKFSLLPLLFSGIVFYWVAGFDIIYALQDEEFDKSNHLYSIPAKYGKKKALIISRILHVICACLVLFTTYELNAQIPQSSWVIWIAVIAFISMLVYQHLLVKPNDLSKINLAFFTTNGIASVVFGGLIILDLFL